MSDALLIEKTIAFVKGRLMAAEGGHDWFHIQRVFGNTLLIAKEEEVDILVVSLGALLHDIADSKFHGGDENIGPKVAREFLNSIAVQQSVINQVEHIIQKISFKNTLEENSDNHTTKELLVVQDADRLDAMGAIGIARAFHYGGFMNNKIYDPEIAPNPKISKRSYKKGTGPSINHFYEKLLLLKDKMNTQTGRKLADQRHRFMLLYLEQFYAEWNGKK